MELPKTPMSFDDSYGFCVIVTAIKFKSKPKLTETFNISLTNLNIIFVWLSHSEYILILKLKLLNSTRCNVVTFLPFYRNTD